MGKIVSSAPFTRAPYPPLRGPPSPRGGRQRGGGFAAKKKANPASLRSAAPSKGRGLRGYSLLPMEGGAPKGRRLEGKSGMKDKWERSSQVRRLREHPIHRCAVPLPQGGEGKEEAASPQKRKPTPLRCARQPLPREGACVDTPSFLWKEVPQRGGGWKGKAVFLYHSLPKWGRGSVGADRAQAACKRAVLKSSSH